MAAELRKDLFAKMMVQDMAFFDTHKTQDIISRLTLDVQEFKSSFKQVVSQGMKYIFLLQYKIYCYNFWIYSRFFIWKYKDSLFI
jgi:ABC-type multidrug transport system fused ATPase/permease subunit